MKWTRTRAAGALAVGTASALVLTACGSAPIASPTVSHTPVTITFNYWGNFGLTEKTAGPSLESVYEADHPWVDLQLVAGEYTPTHDLLMQALINGTGAPSISAIDGGYITGFVAQASGFVNLLTLGAGQYQTDYLPWKWAEAANADQTVVIGLGSDVGGLALCYRRDLFEDAGIDPDRDAVSTALGNSWDDFITVGEQYTAETGKKFVDNATTILNAALVQLGTGITYYDKNDKLDMDNVKPAFDIALAAIDADLSAATGPVWTDEWKASLANGDFAVTLCPSWLLAYIKDTLATGTFTGQWDIADIPGEGGNWGGSWYTIPAQGSANSQQEAYNFIEWLIQPDQQLKIMAETGKMPSETSILESDAIVGFKDAFFNDAPYGQIVAQTVLDVPAPIYYAPKNTAIRAAVELVLDDVQLGNVAVADAWLTAVSAAEAADAASAG